MEKGELAPKEQFLPLSTIFCYLSSISMFIQGSDFRDKRLFEITEVEITRVNCILMTSYTIPLFYVNNELTSVVSTELCVLVLL